MRSNHGRGQFATLVLALLGVWKWGGAGSVVAFALTAAVLSQCPLDAQESDRMAPEAQSSNPVTLGPVSRGGPALLQPTADTGGQVTRYGLGFVFQVGPQTAAVSCNVRTVGRGHWDFEDGSDVILLDDLARLDGQRAVVCSRNVEDTNPATGAKRVVVTYPMVVGFVPLGARRADGTQHPCAGTGFGFSQTACFDLNEEGFFTWKQPYTRSWYVHQLAYDGTRFRVVKMETKSPDAPLKTADGAWTLSAPGLSCALPDGDDLLFAVSADNGTRHASGVSRWRLQGGDWKPVAFYDVSGGSEPSLVRDVDGSLLYSVRSAGAEGRAVRVWRSRDGAQNWEQVLHAPDLRANAPVALNQTANGTPYIAADSPETYRAKLCLWPLDLERASVGTPLIARDCVSEFGPAPEGTTWFADHATATTVRLADGKWHNLLAYRVLAFSGVGVGGETITSHTGCYLEEVSSTGSVRPAWRF
ncbi:MAG: sialidase family protein [Armatimonadia bacterium]